MENDELKETIEETPKEENISSNEKIIDELVMENVTNHTANLTARYVRSLSQNFTALLIFTGVVALVMLIFALTGFPLAWIPFGLVVLCMGLIILINVRTIQKGKEVLSKFEGASYEYKFYTKHLEVTYHLGDAEGSESIDYRSLRNASRINAVLAIVLTNNGLLFVDEFSITDKDAYNKLIGILKYNIDLNNKINKNKGNK